MSIEKLQIPHYDLYAETNQFLLRNSDIIDKSAPVTALEKTPEGEYRTPAYPSAKSNDPKPEVTSLHIVRGATPSQHRWFLSSNVSSRHIEVDFLDTTAHCVEYDMGNQNQLISYHELDQKESDEAIELIHHLLHHPETYAKVARLRDKLPVLQRELTRVALKARQGSISRRKLAAYSASLEASMKFPSTSLSSQENVLAKASRTSYASSDSAT